MLALGGRKTPRLLWQIGSWFYANTAGSQAIAVLGTGGGALGTVFGDVELPVLAARAVQLILAGL